MNSSNGWASFASAAETVDCPFSLVVEEARLIFKFLESPSLGVWVAFRDLGLPIAGSFARRVVVHYHRENDRTELGRPHDQIAFDWDARSFLLPDFHGVLRFRTETLSRTRIVMSGTYVPPFGWLGVWVDRSFGRKIAHAALGHIMRRLRTELEALWASERATSAETFVALGRSDLNAIAGTA